MAKYDAQIARMMELANFGTVNESAHNNKTNINNNDFEYQMMGADGRSYAIVRESKYYYIKSADADKKNLAEAYDYLGGYMNRKNFEYSSYPKALRNFELKMRSLNEAFDGKSPVEVLNPSAKETVIAEGSDKMKDSIARTLEIIRNAQLIREGKEIGASRKDDVVKYDGKNDEAPTGKRGDEELKSADKPIENKDFKKKTNGVDKKAGPFDEEPKKGKDQLKEEAECNLENGNCKGMESWGIKDKATQGPITVDDADKIDAPHLNEEDKEWGSEGLGETGVGEADTDHNNGPFTQNVDEGCCGVEEEGCAPVDECGDMMLPEEDEEPEEMAGDEEIPEEPEMGDAEAEGDEEYMDDEEMPEDGEDEEIVDDEEEPEEGDDQISALMARIEELEAKVAELEGGDDEEAPVDDEEPMDDEPVDDEVPEEDADAEAEDAEPEDFQDEEPMLGEDALCEAKKRYMEGIVNKVVNSILSEEKTVLHDFGKHPGYRKKVMSLPQTGADKTEHGEDWNDDSVHNEKPFGEKIGSSAPFDDVVEMITDSVMNTLKKK